MASCINKCHMCFKIITKIMLQCLKGHYICEYCCTDPKICIICSMTIVTIRNLELEDVISKIEVTKLKTECPNARKGCKYAPNINKLESHAKECRFRKFTCEGYLYCNWDCNWQGDFEELLLHFGREHRKFISEYKYEEKVTINLSKNRKILKIIDFSDGAQVFWYKHKIDTSKKKCYWVFQCVGPVEYSRHYYYEFEIYSDRIRKLKITEICHSDSEDIEKIFEEESCVCVSFKTISNYLQDGNQLSFRFRIMRDKEQTHIGSQSRINRKVETSNSVKFNPVRLPLLPHYVSGSNNHSANANLVKKKNRKYTVSN